MDSGGFTEIANHGKYTISEDEYVKAIELFKPQKAFCQDWMCEPFILKRSGLSIFKHQILTCLSYLSMQSKTTRVAPVLQGWEPRDYLEHAEMYARHGVDMSKTFGVGTICSRNGDPEAIRKILEEVKRVFPHIRLHGFGVKTETLSVVAKLLESADSMAWSSRGRRSKICHWCKVKSCANCMEYALLWRKKTLLEAGFYDQAYWTGTDKRTIPESRKENPKRPKEKR